MALKYRIHGIDTIKLGAVGVNGAMGASLAAIGAIVEESAIFSVEEPEIARITVEGTDEPDIIAIAHGGMKKFIFSTRDLNVDNMVTIFGGEATLEVYTPPVNSNTKIWQSVEITGKYVDGSRALIQIPRALIYAKLNAPFTDSESGVIEVTCEVGTPVNATGVALSPYTYTQVAE